MKLDFNINVDTFLIRNMQDLYEENFTEKYQRTRWIDKTGSCLEKIGVLKNGILPN